MTALSPDHGVRVLLELMRAEEDAAVYRVQLHAKDGSWQMEARLEGAGALTIEGIASMTDEGRAAPEPWMVESARAFLRTLQKNHAAARDWPRRQLRWRERRVQGER